MHLQFMKQYSSNIVTTLYPLLLFLFNSASKNESILISLPSELDSKREANRKPSKLKALINVNT